MSKEITPERELSILRIVNNGVLAYMKLNNLISDEEYKRLHDMVSSDDSENVVVADLIIDEYCTKYNIL